MKNFNRESGFNYKKGGGFKDGKKPGGFERKGPGGFGRSSESRGFGRDRDNGERPEMHQATCADCGQSCQVPFRPISGKPVFCSNCFKTKDAAAPRRTDDRNSSRSFGRDDNARPAQSNGISNEQFEALTAKLDKIIVALSTLTPAKPKVLTEEEEIMQEIEDFEEPKKVVKATKEKAKKSAASKGVAARKAKK